MESRVAGKIELLASRGRVAVSRSAIGGAGRRVFGRHSHRAADAGVVFDPSDDCAVAAQRRKRDPVFLGKRFLETKPDSERVLRIGTSKQGLSFLDGFLAQPSTGASGPYLHETKWNERACAKLAQKYRPYQ